MSFVTDKAPDNPLLDGPEVMAEMEQHTKEEAANSTVEVYQTPEGNFKFKLKMRPFSTYDHSKPPKPKKLMHGWLPERRTAALTAAGGMLKTTLLVDQAIETAKQGKLAVIVSTEDEADDYYGKFWSALNTPESRHYGLDIGKLSEFIGVVDLSGTGVKLSASADNLQQRAKWVDELIDDIRSMGKKVGFVAFETASRLCFGEENTDFSAAITITDHVAMTLNCSCVISHHTAKFVAREKVVDNHAGRGGSALGDNTRSSLVMTKLDRNYKGIRQPKVLPDEINEGKIIEMAHARNSFGPTIEPRYFRAKSGAGQHPIMEEIESVRRGSREELEWKEQHREVIEDEIGQMILDYMREAEESGGELVSSGWIDSKLKREEHLNGCSRPVARAAIKALVAAGKAVKVEGGRGKPTNYHLPGSAPEASEVEAPEAPSRVVDSNGNWYEGELLEDGKPRYLVCPDGGRMDRLEELNAAPY